MKDYYIEFSNGEYDFVEARNDKSAYHKAIKLAKQMGTFVSVKHLYEQFEEDDDRKIF